MQINETDLKNIKAFKNIMLKSKVELQGSTISIVSNLFDWFNNLEDRFKESFENEQDD